MQIGIITGSGTYALPGLQALSVDEVQTPFGSASVTAGSLAGADVLHISRHGEGHPRLSNHVAHQANILALKQSGADAVLAVTVCGALETSTPLGSLIVFDDLHFISNRLPDGSLCTLHTEPGVPGRGHWVYDRPFSEPLRQALLAGAAQAGVEARDGGTYGHVDGPRFNTRPEIRMLADAGVTAVSQTAGPEVVLAGEASLPYALLGYPTDHANGVSEVLAPVSELLALLQASTAVFGSVLQAAIPRVLAADLQPVGTHLTFD